MGFFAHLQPHETLPDGCIAAIVSFG